MIEFQCPHCRERLSVPSSLAGQAEECPKCKVRVAVPKTRQTTAASPDKPNQPVPDAEDGQQVIPGDRGSPSARRKRGAALTPLHVEDEERRTPILSRLMHRLFGSWFNKALLSAAEDGNVEDVVSLLEKGADPNAQDAGGRTALHYAARKGNLELATVLLSAGSNVNAKENSGGGIEEWALGNSPLHFAAANGETAMVRFLLDNGADINATDYRGDTPLDHAGAYHASHFPDSSTVDFIQQRGGQHGRLFNTDGADKPQMSQTTPLEDESPTPILSTQTRIHSASETANTVFDKMLPAVQDASHELVRKYSWGKQLHGSKAEMKRIVLKTVTGREQASDFDGCAIEIKNNTCIEIFVMSSGGTFRQFNVFRRDGVIYTCGDYDIP